MASRQARQDRLLERQRGAGRQVRGGGLELVLPEQDGKQLQPRKSGRSSKTPQADALRPQKSSRRTPARELTAQRSSRKTPASSAASRSLPNRTPAEQAISAKRSRGRPPSGSSKKRDHASIEDQSNDLDPASRQAKRLKADRNSFATSIQPRFSQNSSSRAEDAPEPDLQKGSSVKKRKKRKSIGQQSNRRPKPNTAVHSEHADQIPTPRRGRPKVGQSLAGEAGLDDEIQQQVRREAPEVAEGEVSNDETIVLPSIEPTRGTGFTPHKKRKKRVSIGQQSRRKPRAELVAVKEESEASGLGVADIPEPTGLTELDHDGDQEDGQAQQDESGDDELVGTPAKMKQQPKTKGRGRSSLGKQARKPSAVASGPSNAYISQSPDSSLTPPEGGHQIPPKGTKKAPRTVTRGLQLGSQAHGRPGTKTKGATNPKSRTRKPLERQSGKVSHKPAPSGTVPITVYRPPTPESGSSSDEDRAASGRAGPSASKSFNAVDVLAQITLERLSKRAATLNSHPDTSRTQRKALELYTREVESRLRQLSQALENSKALDATIKGLARDERSLKADLKQVEAERSALKEQREELEAQKKRLELGSLLGRIEQVARKGWGLE